MQSKAVNPELYGFGLMETSSITLSCCAQKLIKSASGGTRTRTLHRNHQWNSKHHDRAYRLRPTSYYPDNKTLLSVLNYGHNLLMKTSNYCMNCFHQVVPHSSHREFIESMHTFNETLPPDRRYPMLSLKLGLTEV